MHTKIVAILIQFSNPIGQFKRKILAGLSIFTIFLQILPVVFAPRSHAAVSPLSIAIVPPVQFPPDDFSVTGARLSLGWGRHRQVYGLDLGLLGNITELNFAGLAVSGLFNWTKGTTDVLGLQLAGLTNVNTNKTNIIGFQLAGILNMNTASSMVTGLQAALIGNISPFTNIYGVQIGLYNRALDVYGFQIGLVNVADNLHGVQIGLVNFNLKGLFYVSPILNIGF